jgi:hypothetical protein
MLAVETWHSVYRSKKVSSRCVMRLTVALYGRQQINSSREFRDTDTAFLDLDKLRGIVSRFWPNPIGQCIKEFGCDCRTKQNQLALILSCTTCGVGPNSRSKVAEAVWSARSKINLYSPVERSRITFKCAFVMNRWPIIISPISLRRNQPSRISPYNSAA